MSNNFDKKEFILKTALDLTSKFGLEALSIGQLAKSVGMSKSGLFGHFKSKEKLQIMVLDYAADNFIQQVIYPAIKKPRGLKRLDDMMINWKKWSSTHLAGGCPILSSIVEYDDRPGEVRSHVQNLQTDMIKTFEKTLQISILTQELSANTNIKQLAYEIYSNMIGYHVYGRLLSDKNADNLFKSSYNKIIGHAKTA